MRTLANRQQFTKYYSIKTGAVRVATRATWEYSGSIKGREAIWKEWRGREAARWTQKVWRVTPQTQLTDVARRQQPFIFLQLSRGIKIINLISIGSWSGLFFLNLRVFLLLLLSFRNSRAVQNCKTAHKIAWQNSFQWTVPPSALCWAK